MRLYRINVAAGAAFDLAAFGDYVLVRSSAVDLIIENPEEGEKIEVSQGDDFQFTKFSSLRISHSSVSDQDIKLVISTGKKAGSAKVGGSLSLAEPISGSGSNTQKTVTNASASMIAANANRKFLAIQNKDASGKLYINFGAAATQANGLLIPPGGYFELNANMLTAEVFAIGDIVSNTNIIVIEG